MDKDMKNKLDELENMFLRFQPRTSLQFQVDLTRHCNMKCKYCGNFSPLAEKEFLDLDEYRADLKRLSELFQGEAKRIILQGGEPLLHPQINAILQATREFFPVGDILVITNGILIPSMEDTFWEICKEFHIKLTPTEYPLTFDYAACQKLAEEKGVFYLAHDSNRGQKHKKMLRFLISLKPLDRPEHNFAHCEPANRCITLAHGKMYTCSQAASIGDLKKYFDLDLHISEQNGVDIYKVKDKEELMRKMAQAIPLCAHCDIAMREFEEDWSVSQKSRYEWLGFEFLEEDFAYLERVSFIYIFGAGELGMETIRRLHKRNIKVEAVLVTRNSENQAHVDGVQVANVHELGRVDEDSICLMALYGANAKREVYPILQQCGFKNILPVYGLHHVE